MITTSGYHDNETITYNMNALNLMEVMKREIKQYNLETLTITKIYKIDENGRIISAEIIDDSKENIPEYQTYHYETLYFYTEE